MESAYNTKNSGTTLCCFRAVPVLLNGRITRNDPFVELYHFEVPGAVR